MGPTRPLPPAAAHAFVDDLAEPALDAGDRHHFERVLRLRPGQAVTVADGAGRWRSCVWRAGGALEPTGPVADEGPAGPAVTVAFALTKGERPEWVVQKLTEVGVDRIVAFRAARSVVRWDGAKEAANLERWRRVARQAAMQCRRARLPEVSGVPPFAEEAAAAGGFGALAAPGGPPPTVALRMLLVGPEGGWADEELACGLPVCGLGPTVLRAETAALAAGVLLCGLRNGTIRPFADDPQ
ncbi:MAG TPA: RsmE family RNA methyltransferase [Acidimicrobiales bacterium]|nr:RsmE family RNA methyltransferase [Acidimicrobiales bacterium]